MTKFSMVLVLFSLFSLRVNADPNMSELAYRVVGETWNELFRCGLRKMDAYDPRLPRPIVPARYAVVNSKWQVLAYTNEEYGVGFASYAFKNPNGSYRHAVSFGEEWLDFVTPYQGTVASANRVLTVGGPSITYRCFSQVIDPVGWQQCVRARFTMLIADQLCRFPLD